MLLWLHNLDFAGGGNPTLGPTKGGRVRGGTKPRRIVVEVDGELFEVASIAEAESVLLQVRELAQQSAANDVVTTIPKPPKVRVLGPSGKPTTSVTLQRAVKQTQKVITRAYVDRAKEVRLIIEQAQADEEDAITALMLI